VLRIGDLGRKQATEKKNANQEIGVPGLKMHYYLIITIRSVKRSVKEKSNVGRAWQGLD